MRNPIPDRTEVKVRNLPWAQNKLSAKLLDIPSLLDEDAGSHGHQGPPDYAERAHEGTMLDIAALALFGPTVRSLQRHTESGKENEFRIGIHFERRFDDLVWRRARRKR